MELPKSDAPNDFIQWWVENAKDKQSDSYALTAALIQLNIAGIQSTGMVVCHHNSPSKQSEIILTIQVMQALFDLAGRPEYIKPLRKELETIIAEEGTENLSPQALGKLIKMDSFLKESQRHVAQNICQSTLKGHGMLADSATQYLFTVRSCLLWDWTTELPYRWALTSAFHRSTQKLVQRLYHEDLRGFDGQSFARSLEMRKSTWQLVQGMFSVPVIDRSTHTALESYL